MHPPIRKCKMGHNFCNTCYRSSRSCPQCEEMHVYEYDFLMEEFYNYLWFPCKFKEKGCTYSCMGSEISAHETNCFINWKRCVFKTVENCTWMGPKQDYVQHYRDIHRDRFYEEPNVMVFWTNFREECSLQIVINGYKELFLCIFSASKQNDLLSWRVNLLGDVETAVKYKFEVFTIDTREKFRALCGSVTDDISSVFSYSQILRFFDEGDFGFIISITPYKSSFS